MRCQLLALDEHEDAAQRCPFSGVERKWLGDYPMSPKTRGGRRAMSVIGRLLGPERTCRSFRPTSVDEPYLKSAVAPSLDKL